jgi:hypothetical protein
METFKREPSHIGIIPDGNRRWAEANGYQKKDGYQYGVGPGFELYEMMLDYGIQGIECYHPENNEEITYYAIETCNKHKLLITGGSDCHGEFAPGRRIGYPDIRFDMLNLAGLIK